MQTTISYNIPEESLDWILELLGYSEWSKEDFMNQKLTDVVIPSITNAFVELRRNKIQDELSKLSNETNKEVREMISITTV
jgi:hypothetical protein